ncbi:head-tail connector protein [Sphingomonas adhaesiva]|uniref:head-tail connector protein n=1 Tax=Sphingomonas adhaesiva TaxID=28212 RepID=UPI002FF86517
MAFTLRPVAPPDAAAIIPPTLIDQHLKPASDADAELIDVVRLAAIDHIERYTGRSLQRRAWAADFDGFGCSLRLPRSPIGAVTAVRYIGTEGTVLSATGWRIADDLLVSGVAGWPVALAGPGVVTVEFTAGYLDVASEAPALRMAVVLMMRHLYDGGNGEATAAIAAMCRPYRVPVMA